MQIIGDSHRELGDTFGTHWCVASDTDLAIPGPIGNGCDNGIAKGIFGVGVFVGIYRLLWITDS